MHHRKHLKKLIKRMGESRRFIQVIAGPRQVGKTTVARALMDRVAMPVHYASADMPGLRAEVWLEQQWAIGRLRAESAMGEGHAGDALLILDEVQKVGGWSEGIKRLWDEDSARGLPLRVLILGSAPLLLQAGLPESLAGRFETVRMAQWSLTEMQAAFGWDLEHYLYFGGYPGAATLVDDEARWSSYIRDALVETTVARDILLLRRVDKPALLRRVFDLACGYSGQVLSYNKMLGQLQDAGNTTTLAHYLDLLAAAGLAVGLQRFAGQQVRSRASSPKLLVQDTALMTATSGLDFAATREDRARWGRLVESAIGGHLLRETRGTDTELFWWRERGHEVDFVLRRGDRVVPIEVKSGRARNARAGMAAFARLYTCHRKLLVGGGGVGVAEFLSSPVDTWLAGHPSRRDNRHNSRISRE